MSKRKKNKLKAGAVVFRAPQGQAPEVLLITGRKHTDSWVFPVGTVKDGEPLEEAAKRECVEESGYIVHVGEQLPELVVVDGMTEVTFIFFLATVAGKASDWERDRQQQWVPATELVDLVPAVFEPVARVAVNYIQCLGTEE